MYVCRRLRRHPSSLAWFCSTPTPGVKWLQLATNSCNLLSYNTYRGIIGFMERRKIFSRRDFLKSGSIGAIAAVSTFYRNKGTIRPSDIPDTEWRERGKVLIAGEAETFEFRGVNIRATVNEVAFTSAIKGTAALNGKRGVLLEDFIRLHPVRIVLHKELGSAYARYLDTGTSQEPQIQFSTNYLISYLEASIANDGKKIKGVDTTVFHELWHMWQDASSKLLVYASPIRSGTTGFLTTAGAIFGNNIEKTPVKRPDSGRKQAISAVKFGFYGFMSGYSLLTLANPPEIDAFINEGRLVDSPEFAPFKGKYFYFERV